MSNINLGIIGSGHMGEYQGQFFSSHENCRVIGCADTDQSKAAALADKIGIRAFETPQALLTDSSVDLVYIAVPHRFLASYGIEAARQGKHVIVEKPMSVSLTEARTLVDTCQKNGVTLAVDEQVIFEPVQIGLKKVLKGTDFGEPYGLVSVGGGMSFFPGYPKWQGQRDMGGGVGWNWGSHTLYQILWLLDTLITEVYADYGAFVHDIDADDNIALLLRTESGAMLSMRVSCSTMSESFLEIWSADNQVTLRDGQINRPPVERGDRVPPMWETVELPAREGKSYHLMNNALISALLEGREPPVSGSDYLHVVEVLEAAYRTKDEGRKIVLPQKNAVL